METTTNQVTPDRNTMDKVRSAGLYAKGVVYGIVGILAAMAAFGAGGDITGTTGAIGYLQQMPAGNVLLALVAIGLLAYALWRFYEAIEDPQGGGDENRAPKRAYYAYSGVVYGLLAYAFAKPLFGGGGSSGGQQKEALLAQLLDQQWGAWLVGVIAVVVAGMALYQFYKSYTGDYMKKLEGNPGRHYNLIKKAGRWGYAARGVVFGIISFFLFRVMSAHNADAYRGTEGALQYLLSLNYGNVLLALVALGLVGYAIFNIMAARHTNLSALG